MKYFFIGFIVILSIPGFSQKEANKINQDTLPPKQLIPAQPNGWVSDFENIFTAEQVHILDSIISRQEIKNMNQIAIVTLSLDSTLITSLDDFDTFSLRFFNGWGVGKKEKNNGIGILISTHLRKIRIQTGTGLIEKLTDEEAKIIIDTIIIPEFKNGRYYSGTLLGLQAILKEIE